MHPDTPADITPAASQLERPVAARGQRPWHQPRLTQVALQATGLGSGMQEDLDGSSNPPK